jgi:hypothetical protein
MSHFCNIYGYLISASPPCNVSDHVNLIQMTVFGDDSKTTFADHPFQLIFLFILFTCILGQVAANLRLKESTKQLLKCQQLVDEYILYSLYLHNTLEMIALDLEKSVGGS